AEGAVPPISVEAAKDRVDNAIHALVIDKADHRTRAAAHFDKTAFNHVRGPQLPPEVAGEAKEIQQLQPATTYKSTLGTSGPDNTDLTAYCRLNSSRVQGRHWERTVCCHMAV